MPQTLDTVKLTAAQQTKLDSLLKESFDFSANEDMSLHVYDTYLADFNIRIYRETKNDECYLVKLEETNEVSLTPLEIDRFIKLALANQNTNQIPLRAEQSEKIHSVNTVANGLSSKKLNELTKSLSSLTLTEIVHTARHAQEFTFNVSGFKDLSDAEKQEYMQFIYAHYNCCKQIAHDSRTKNQRDAIAKAQLNYTETKLTKREKKALKAQASAEPKKSGPKPKLDGKAWEFKEQLFNKDLSERNRKAMTAMGLDPNAESDVETFKSFDQSFKSKSQNQDQASN